MDCKLARVTHTMMAAVHTADQFRAWDGSGPQLDVVPFTSKSWHGRDVFRTMAYDVEPPWRISRMHYKVVTGVVPRQSITGSKPPQEGMERAEKVPWTTVPESLPSRCSFLT